MKRVLCAIANDAMMTSFALINNSAAKGGFQQGWSVAMNAMNSAWLWARGVVGAFAEHGVALLAGLAGGGRTASAGARTSRPGAPGSYSKPSSLRRRVAARVALAVEPKDEGGGRAHLEPMAVAAGAELVEGMAEEVLGAAAGAAVAGDVHGQPGEDGGGDEVVEEEIVLDVGLEGRGRRRRRPWRGAGRSCWGAAWPLPTARSQSSRAARLERMSPRPLRKR